MPHRPDWNRENEKKSRHTGTCVANYGNLDSVSTGSTRTDGVGFPRVDRTDGVSLEFDTWRMNLRSSNTEPLLRLNVETKGDKEAVRKHVRAIESLIEAQA